VPYEKYDEAGLDLVTGEVLKYMLRQVNIFKGDLYFITGNSSLKSLEQVDNNGYYVPIGIMSDKKPVYSIKKKGFW